MHLLQTQMGKFLRPVFSASRVQHISDLQTSANLECMSEMCCTRLAENTGRKNSSSGHHSTTFSGYVFATKERIDNPKTHVKLEYGPMPNVMASQANIVGALCSTPQSLADAHY